MASEAIHPLKIHKLPDMASPSKLPRPLQELGATERRRNSPSYNQATRKMIVSRDSSPFEASPTRSSPFWQKEDASPAPPGRLMASATPDRDVSPYPSKRPSVENLKKASRVANSPMFARETRDKYDPSSSPVLERPLTDRPLSDRIQQNPFTRLDNRKENSPFKLADRPTHRRAESKTDTIEPAVILNSTSPHRSGSPIKSSFSSKPRSTDAVPQPRVLVTDDEPSGMLRPMKSVTFQSAPVVTEYEQQTPEPSTFASEDESQYSDDAEDQSLEHDSDTDSFDASLEDVNKTPVVMPGEWQRHLPNDARASAVDDTDDVFDINARSPAPGTAGRSQTRSESVASDGSARPLPAIPSPQAAGHHHNSPSGLLLDQLKMLSVDAQRSESRSPEPDEFPAMQDFDYAPMISRESILRKVQYDKAQASGIDASEDQLSLHSPADIDYSELARVDPDVPIVSRENSTHFDQLAAAAVKEESVDMSVNMDDIPVLPATNAAPLHDREVSDSNSVVHNNLYASEESQSRYSESLHSTDESGPLAQQQIAGLGISHQDVFLIPMEESREGPSKADREISLPFLSHQLNTDDLDLGLNDYIATSPSPEAFVQENKSRREMSVVSPPPGQTRRSTTLDCVNSDDESDGYESVGTPVVPERKATIKTGGRLKARPSGTPGELELILAAQRQEYDDGPVPQIPDEYRGESGPESRPASAGSYPPRADSVAERNPELDLNLARSVSGAELGLAEEMDRIMDGQKRGYLMRQNTKVIVASNRNVSGEVASRSASGAAAQMREPSSRKASTGEKFISTEPWNGRRRRSSRYSSGPRKSNIGLGPALPGQDSALGIVDEDLVQQDDDEDDEQERGRLFVKVSGVKELDLPLPRNDRLKFQLTLDNGMHCVTTADIDLGRQATIGQEFELVVLSDLEFQLTLTTNIPAPPRIVPSTMSGISTTSSTKRSPTKSLFSRLLSSPKKRAETERRERQEAEEAERQRHEDFERERLAAAKDAPYERLRDLVDAKTGSFARSYVSLKSHEEHCFGRQLVVDVPLYNEWALEKDAHVVSSVRSKRSQGTMGQRDGAVRRPPYIVGSLMLQLLYVPKPKDATDIDMPKSMSSAIREMTAAEKVKESKHEGFMSQEGGDCRHWRRRYFRLTGTKLTAFHEHTRQPRATINLAKATKLVDDKTSLIAHPEGGDPTRRRRSAFAEQDDGYQFIAEGFRIRFANGETIDFYAEDAAAKDAWMAALSQCIGKQSPKAIAKWTDVVLAKEKTDKSSIRQASATSSQATTAVGGDSMRKDSGNEHKEGASPNVLNSPAMTVHRCSEARDFATGWLPSPDLGVEASKATRRPGTPPLASGPGHQQKRKAVKSMIF